jgi:hypothetical protein
MKINVREYLLYYHQVQFLMDKILARCAQYTGNANMVFASCGGERRGDHMAILEKCHDTKTFESNSMNAICRADRLKTICIFPKNNPEMSIDRLQNTHFGGPRLLYEVGKIIKAEEYNEEIYTGIQYYKTPQAAFYCDIQPLLGEMKYTGEYCNYNIDGTVYAIYYFDNGEMKSSNLRPW